jgi:hypothetical protein
MASTFTQAECADLFLDAVAEIVAEQARQPGLSASQRCANVASGILLLIDQGDGASGMPGWILAPDAVPETMAYQLSLGEDAWPTGALAYGVNVAGGLSDQFVEGVE